MRIKSLSVKNLWSFGDPGLEIEDLGKCNVIIGKNNSGKSKILSAISWIKRDCSVLFNVAPFALDPDIHHEREDVDNSGGVKLVMSVCFERNELESAVREAEKELKGTTDDPIARLVADYVQPEFTFGFSSAKTGERPTAFVQINSPPLDYGKARSSGNVSAEEIIRIRHNWDNRGVLVVHKHLLTAVGNSIEVINGWRTLRETRANKRNIIQDLHEWHAPSQENKGLRHKFTRIQELFRNLMLSRDFELKPEFNGEKLSVLSKGRYLPIEALGDGVQHLLIAAYHIATTPAAVLLFEEPETHIHPELQRNLMKVLQAEFRGQLVMTTHSSVLLDANSGSHVFRVEHDLQCSKVTECKTSKDMCGVLDQLGVRASDILQANFVIWVEGPTDRMFLNRCLELLNGGLKEGVHYQVAFYGGRLRSHYTFDELQPGLSNLMKLCRRVAMICDSDKESDSAELEASKIRLAKECEDVGGFSWVTDGREIENYFPDDVLTAAFREMLDRSDFSIVLGQFEKLADVVRRDFPEATRGNKWKVAYEEHKVRIMFELLKHLSKCDLKRWGLSDRLQMLITQIETANSSYFKGA